MWTVFVFSGLALFAKYVDGAPGFSGEGPADAPTTIPKLKLVEDREEECRFQGPLPKYNFTFKNRVLPEHCEMIYYGSCRNSLQCNICDNNRILPKGVREGPKTYCMKSGDDKTDNATGTCAPCARCTICKDMRKAWDSADVETDCRVPTICPDAMDEIENSLKFTVKSYQNQIDELIQNAEKSKTDSDEQNKALGEIEKLKDQLKKELEAEHQDRSLVLNELKRLQEEKEELKKWIEDANAGCAEQQQLNCMNTTFAQMNDMLEKDRLASLQLSLDLSNPRDMPDFYHKSKKCQIGGTHDKDCCAPSAEVASCAAGYDYSQGDTNCSVEAVVCPSCVRTLCMPDADTQMQIMHESLDRLSNIGQTKSDLKNETKDFRADIDSYLATISDLRSQVQSSISIEDNQNAKTIATVFVVLFILTFTVVLVLLNRRRKLEAIMNKDAKEELMGGGEYGEDEEDTIFARKAPTMNAWDDYDQTDGMRLSEAHKNIEVMNDVLPGRAGSSSRSNVANADIAGTDGQLGYVTKTKMKISESAFGTQTAC